MKTEVLIWMKFLLASLGSSQRSMCCCPQKAGIIMHSLSRMVKGVLVSKGDGKSGRILTWRVV